MFQCWSGNESRATDLYDPKAQRAYVFSFSVRFRIYFTTSTFLQSTKDASRIAVVSTWSPAPSNLDSALESYCEHRCTPACSCASCTVLVTLMYRYVSRLGGRRSDNVTRDGLRCLSSVVRNGLRCWAVVRNGCSKVEKDQSCVMVYARLGGSLQ